MAIDDPLLRSLDQLCRKGWLLEILRDSIVCDAGIKKTCRHNQYFGVRRRQCGVIWHTQGSGRR
ncbi:hypothetical protein [Nitrococcus mobilis]|uniref:Putative DNA restriction-modification system, restriction enzyme n=1 Tax=Nitrococcus mobilis Nb-231 TaxID=314278 RepID=A4BMC6_9GAMM|nr:hypothetical protein [Nitrococcus mobilis]EAR23464.1 putative DNA restriction-modification system, restriction enzyme [Nitrococcus mobilis Nb-231]